MPVVVRGAQCGAFSAPLCTTAGPDLRHAVTCTLALPGSLPGAALRAARTLRTVSYGCVVPPACVRGEHRAAFCAPTAARPTAHLPRKPALMVCHNMSRATLYERLRLLPSLALL
jgi:hypothetical protein